MNRKEIRNVIELFIAWNGEDEAIDVANLDSAVDFVAESMIQAETVVKETIADKGDDGYDGKMDKECIAVCNALNDLPGVKTIESCCGHCRNPYRIWFKATNPYSIGIIARVFDKRYSGTNLRYYVKVETNDVGECPMYSFMIESEAAYRDSGEMEKDLSTILDNIRYWKSPVYYDYFSGDKDSKLPKVWPRDNLDEYAYQVAYDLSNDWAKDNPDWQDVEDACKLGAKWQKEHTMKEQTEWDGTEIAPPIDSDVCG